MLSIRILSKYWEQLSIFNVIFRIIFFYRRLLVDDYENEEISVQNAEELPLMREKYSAFFGGMPQDVTLRSSSVGALDDNWVVPFIGCIRDILIGNDTGATTTNHTLDLA